MASGRKPPGNGDEELAQRIHVLAAASMRMEKAFVAMGKRVHEGNQQTGEIIKVLREMNESQRRLFEIVSRQSQLLIESHHLLKAVLIALGHSQLGYLYPKTTGVSVTPAGD